jgi:uncharacterized heparinase superfamily protein
VAGVWPHCAQVRAWDAPFTLPPNLLAGHSSVVKSPCTAFEPASEFMQRLTISEHAQVARLTLNHQRRSAVSTLRRSPLLRWKFGAPQIDDLLISPHDLRGADPSFASEIATGHFGLGGALAKLGGQSPFAVPAPSAAWERDLHGFVWLRHLNAAADPKATRAAQDLVADWLQRSGARHPVGGLPEVASSRLVAWLCHADVLLDGASDERYNNTLDSLGEQVVTLLATWPEAAAGYPRLHALAALLMATLCIANLEHLHGGIEAQLVAELQHQVNGDGGHISRNPSVVIDLLLDLLPLRQCYSARERSAPIALDLSIERMQGMLQFMRLGCGSVARFNGMACVRPEAVATVLAYAAGSVAHSAIMPSTQMARLERGAVIVLADVGSPPPLEVSGQAHAGCLSFELSVGDCPLFVNGGAPGPAHHTAWVARGRATASHNTLTLGGQSSSKLVRDPRLEDSMGAPPLCAPDDVQAKLTETADGGLMLEASHDGYVERTNLWHHRRIAVSPSGDRVSGLDRLGAPSRQLRLPTDIPFAIHFHLAPTVLVRSGEIAGTADFTLDDGTTWRFAAVGAELSIEESSHLALAGGPARTEQIVLRGATFGETEVQWSLKRLPA